jgi:hypothetical protein
MCRTSGPLTEGPGLTSSPGNLPAPRVACHCSPVGFDRQQSATKVEVRDVASGGTWRGEWRHGGGAVPNVAVAVARECPAVSVYGG